MYLLIELGDRPRSTPLATFDGAEDAKAYAQRNVPQPLRWIPRAMGAAFNGEVIEDGVRRLVFEVWHVPHNPKP